jgi:hypothetical protein
MVFANGRLRVVGIGGAVWRTLAAAEAVGVAL